jgi:AraC-like DNA-binding protein
MMLLSRNYAPSERLAPFIRRHYVFEANLPQDFGIEDKLIADNAFVRILLKGEWAAETAPGEWSTAGQILLFGANSMPLNVRVRGPFEVAGFAIRPSAWRALFAQPAAAYADRMAPLSEVWGDEAATMLAAVRAAENDEAKVDAMEASIIRQIHRVGRPRVDDEMARFESIARTDSTRRVEDIAREFGMSVRQMERRTLATFGLTPKSVLRRSRFLDMAAALRGFSAPDERELAALRYFDQSHLNREFRRFVHMTPKGFRDSTTPLFTAGLKLRVEGKDLA